MSSPSLPPGQPFPISKPLGLTISTFRNHLCFSSLNASYVPFRVQVSFMLGILISLDRGGSILTTHPAPLLEDMAVSGGTGRKHMALDMSLHLPESQFLACSVGFINYPVSERPVQSVSTGCMNE